MSQTPDPAGSPSPTPASGPHPNATSSGLLPTASTSDEPTLGERATRMLLGGPRDLKDRRLFHSLTLVSVLAWIGLGADALSSSSYGPQEGYRVVRDHPHLALALAVLTAGTVFLISAAYSKLIEVFPNGGGYGVASRMLGPRVGVISGCALLIDYVLTITVSIAAMGDALFSFLPAAWAPWKFPGEAAIIIGLIVLNLRGVKESIVWLTPIFLAFVLVHVVLIGGGLVLHLNEAGAVATRMADGFQTDMAGIGVLGMLMLLLKAYSLGGGTYTGIEAVSNALPLLREPRVATAKRTMLYLAVSLAVTAAGLVFCYLLWDIPEVAGKTANAVLAEQVGAYLPWSGGFVISVLVTEALLLVVAAQAGFIGGPRVLANLAVDSWMPHRFAALSERLNTENGILIMGVLALGGLWWTGGDITTLVVMYAINVFLSFSLTMLGMVRWWWRSKAVAAVKARRIALFGTGFVICATILGVTAWQEFSRGGAVALVATGLLAALCLLIHAHYQLTIAKLRKLYAELGNQPRTATPPKTAFDPKAHTAVVLVGGYGGLGIHTVLNVFKTFPHVYKNLVFVSVGVVDSGAFKGEDTVEELRARTQEHLVKYVELANGLGVPSVYRMAIGTDAIDEAEKLCLEVAKEFPRSTFFAGKIIFQRERWYHWLLHNNTANAVQKRLHWVGRTMVILPARLR
jgi:amino acid transporter